MGISSMRMELKWTVSPLNPDDLWNQNASRVRFACCSERSEQGSFEGVSVPPNSLGTSYIILQKCVY